MPENLDTFREQIEAELEDLRPGKFVPLPADPETVPSLLVLYKAGVEPADRQASFTEPARPSTGLVIGLDAGAVEAIYARRDDTWERIYPIAP